MVLASLGYHDHFTIEEFLSVFIISLYPMIDIPWEQFIIFESDFKKWKKEPRPFGAFMMVKRKGLWYQGINQSFSNLQ